MPSEMEIAIVRTVDSPTKRVGQEAVVDVVVVFKFFLL